jgi:hypothetical protein
VTSVRLPQPDGSRRIHELGPPGRWVRPEAPLRSRTAYAAAHVVPRPLADNTPGSPASLDWDATLRYRHELWSYGLGVADAMDTAQRGMGLDWVTTKELIRRSGVEAAASGGRLACGAGTDQLDLDALPAGRAGLDVVLDAYLEQVELVTRAGAQVILMASRALARVARTPTDYQHVYAEVLRQVHEPVILHWLGPMFDPQLAGYWGSTDVPAATETFLDLVRDHAERVAGVKVYLLDAGHEVALRAELAGLATPVRLYTGDDFNYPELIHGDGQHHSDALLGIFAAIYPAASAALQAYDAGEPERGLALLESTVELGRHIFCDPTPRYKTGIAFLSWLNGHQPGFVLVGGLQASRSLPHLVRILELADRAGLLLEPDLAARRMSTLLQLYGVEA